MDDPETLLDYRIAHGLGVTISQVRNMTMAEYLGWVSYLGRLDTKT